MTMIDGFGPALTLQEAAQEDAPGILAWGDVKASPEEVAALVTWFQWLCGMNHDTAPELLAAARADVAGDVKLAAMLAGGPAAFAQWFADDDWSIYELTDATGSDAWARAVLTRCAGLGAVQ